MISPKQLKILEFPFSSYDAIICDGAVRSGKTSIMTVAFIDWAMREFSGQRFGICGKTVDSATKNIIVPYISSSYAKKRYILHWRRSDKVLAVRRGNVTNFFEVFGGKDESSFMLIQGRTLAGILLDEVALMPESFVNQALARCSVMGNRKWFSCNPQSPRHWFYTEWVKKHRERNALYLRFAMTDNPSLPPEVLGQYKTMFSGVFYDRYIRGLWVAAEGLIYRLFADNPDRYIIEDADAYLRATGQSVGSAMIGVDFGGNKSATAFICVLVTKGAREAIVAAEKHIRTEIDPQTLCHEYADFIRNVTERWGNAHTLADSAEQILIRGLYGTALKEHLKTDVKNALKRPILDRIRMGNMLFSQDRLKICRSCRHMIEAFREAVWDDKHEDERLDNGTSDIDSLDAFEYAIEPYMDKLEAAGFRREISV